MPKGGHRWNPKGVMNPAYKGGVVTNPEWFRARYEDDQLSFAEIAELAGRSLRTAARWAHKHGVKIRAHGSDRSRRYGSDHHNWKGGFRNQKCYVCGERRAYRGRSKARCMPCRNNSFKGAGNPNYKGISDIDLVLRGYLKDTWRLEIFARDSFACQVCGDSRGGNLTAHHILKFSVILSRLLVGVPLDEPQERLDAIEMLKAAPEMNDLENGSTLCEPCHKIVHAKHAGEVVPVE